MNTWIIFVFIALYVVFPLTIYILKSVSSGSSARLPSPRAIIVVLGDIGRSPRMMYHARSLVKHNIFVDFIGYANSEPPIPELRGNSRVRFHYLPIIQQRPGEPFVVFAVRKVVLQHVQLVKLLFPLRGADFIILQNPPSIPLLGVARFFRLFLSNSSRLIIDWHNFGYSVLGVKIGPKHLLTRLAYIYELIFGSSAFLHLTVTISMGQVLRQQFGVSGKRVIPLYDRPADQFRPLDRQKQLEVLKAEKFAEILAGFDPDTHKLIITSTSYTPDEDFSVLLAALRSYDGRKSSATAESAAARLPPLYCVVTGKGPMKAEFEKSVEETEFRHVTVRTAWLEAEDYPELLACADVGISLHDSTSGVDLPMKVVDMFGCGVPVVALSFPALPELVKDGENGIVVPNIRITAPSGASVLDAGVVGIHMADALASLFGDPKLYARVKGGAIRESRLRWDDNWTAKLGPIFGIGEYDNGSSFSSSSSDDE